jgi:putative nucleotidyltransferase with HDIG domain
MKGLFLTIQGNGIVLQMHPLLRRYLGKSKVIGLKIDEVFSLSDNFAFIQKIINKIRQRNAGSFKIRLPFDYSPIELARIKLNRKIDIEVIRNDFADGETFMFFGSPIEYIEEYYVLLREKENLYSLSINILKDISMLVLNEPSSKIAARKSVEMVCKLFDANGIILRLYKNNRVFERYVSYGIKGEYLSKHIEVDPRDAPVYQRIIDEKKPIIEENVGEALGKLHADLSAYMDYKMLVVLPILNSDKLIGTLALSFEEPNKLIKESLDILENIVYELNFLLEKGDYFLELLDTTEKLKSLNLAIVTSLSDAIETRDPYTKGHSERVAAYAVEIARNMGWDDYDMERLRIAGVLHDIGKVGIPDAVLLKPGTLSRHEYEIMKLHPELSAAIVSEIDSFTELVPWVRYHHENFDGTGYPYGLKGNEIPLGARILAVADAFDAMTSNRPYRKALPISQVKEIFNDGAGAQWDKEIVNIGLSNLDIIFEKTPSYYHIPEILDEFRQRIFNMNLMDGLYLYEYIHDEIVKYIESNKQFSIAVISVKKYVSSFNSADKKKVMSNIIEIIKKNVHYPILVSRFNYYEAILFAPMVNKHFMKKIINKILVDFFQKTNLFFASNVLSFPQDAGTIDNLIESLLSGKKDLSFYN